MILMVLIESGILWENHVSFSVANEGLETCKPVWFEQLNESKQFWGTFTERYFDKWALSQKSKIWKMFIESYNM